MAEGTEVAEVEAIGGARMSVKARILDSTWARVLPILVCIVLAFSQAGPSPCKCHEILSLNTNSLSSHLRIYAQGQVKYSEASLIHHQSHILPVYVRLLLT